MKTAKKVQKRIRRHAKVRSTISGTAARPRLLVFRSNKHIYAQLIDDTKGVTLAAASDKDTEKSRGKRVEQSAAVGAELAKRATAKKIKNVVFDRGGYIFTGRVAALAKGARDGGLKF